MKERLYFDESSERSYARLRAISTILLIPASVFLLIRGGFLGKLLGVAGFTLSLSYLRRLRRPALKPPIDSLALGAGRIVLYEGEASTTLAREDIEKLSLDEEKLLVRIKLKGGGEIELQPGYGGLGAVALLQRIDRALR